MSSPLTEDPTETMNETPPAFDIVLRGYERRQVEDHLAALLDNKTGSERRVKELDAQVQRLRAELESTSSEQSEPTYAGLGARVEKILRLAEEEARDLRAESQAASEKERAVAAEEAAQVRTLAEEEAQNRVAEGERNAARLVEQARKQAAQIRSEATDDAAAKRGEADSIVEEARARAAQVAADVESKLAKRREQVENDLALRQETAERHLNETAEKSEQLRLEAQKLRDDAERRAKQLLEAARREADDVVADARAKAERSRLDSERELAALTHRRDSINAQLSNVREMLATLTGAAAGLATAGEPPVKAPAGGGNSPVPAKPPTP